MYRTVLFPAILLAVFLMIFGGLSADLPAGEVAAASSGLETGGNGTGLKTAQENFLKTVLDALQNDRQAQKTFLRVYLAPFFMVLTGLFICYVLAGSLGRTVGELVSKRIDLTLGRFLAKAIRNLSMLFVVMAILEYNQVSVSSLAAVMAAMGFAIGLALQGTLSNFAAGVMLMLFRPFRIDEFISVAGVEGIVEEIDLFTTRVNTTDNRHVIIPNSQIFGNMLENYSRNPFRRVEVNVVTPYHFDSKMTRRALEYAVGRIELRPNAPDSKVVLRELGQRGLEWQLRVWVAPKDFWEVREKLTEGAKDSLDQFGINIAVPQFDVQLGGKLLAKSAG
jgi:small conductance mechanosensitive channel